MGSHAQKVLEYRSVLDRLVLHCETQRGADLSAELQPSFEEEEVWRMLELTTQAYRLLGSESAPSLGRVLDLRSSLIRAEKGGTLGGEELFRIGELLAGLRAAKSFFSSKSDSAPDLAALVEHFPSEPRLEITLLDSLDPDGEVRDGASPALASLRKRKTQATARIIERIQSYVSGKHREYLSDPIYTVRDGRYVIPVKSEHRGKIRGIIHDTSGSGQTVYVEPEDVLKAGNDLSIIEGEEREEVQRILKELSSRVAPVATEACAAIEAAATLDIVLAKARLGYEMRGTAPRRAKPAQIKLEGARHPLLDQATVVPIDIEVGISFDGLLITGPNTGGKTVAIKCAGLAVLMAQSGLLVPARDCLFGVFRQVWADIGDEQSIEQSLSTFSGHIKNIAEALVGVKPEALVLFDELGAGTDPAEGAALAQAILKDLHSKGAKTIASTHYGELKTFAYTEAGFVNSAMEFDTKSLRPTYRLLIGAPGASHAMKIAEKYGIPGHVVRTAKELLGSQQQDMAKMVEQLDTMQKLARNAQSEADKRSSELRQAEARAAKKLSEAEEIRRTVNQRANEQIEEALREIRLQAAEIFESLKRGDVDQKKIESARNQLRMVQAEAEERAKEFRQPPSRKSGDEVRLRKGMAVRVEGYAQAGTLLDEPSGTQVLVQIGPLKLKVPVSKLSVAEKASSPADMLKKPKANLLLHKAAHAATEISLRGMRAEDAFADLERFVDDAVLGGIHRARIVHGKGEGILRRMVHDYLKRRKEVESYRMAEPSEGGDGVTVAFFH